MKKFEITSQFKGYRHKEDKTNLPPGYLVVGSQNVVTNTAGRVSIRKGYTLDGQANNSLKPITASYDWQMHIGQERNLRAYLGELEYRYVDPTQTNAVPEWRRLVNGLPENFNFAEFWSPSEGRDVLLAVNGTSNIYQWSGTITRLFSATANTITKTGSTTWAEENADAPGGQVIINGNTYTYTGGTGTTTLTGVSPSPAAEPLNSIIHQAIITTANSSMTGLPSTFSNDLIGFLYNQIYIGSFESREVYVSKENNYQDYTFSNPRLPGEGAILILDATPVGFIPQESSMYITAGLDQWYKTEFILSGYNTLETLDITRLKTVTQQAAQSQAFIEKIKNKIVFLSNEPSVDLLGRIEDILNDPQTVNISDPIKDDMDSYADHNQFIGGATKYFKNFIYMSVPGAGAVRIFNLQQNWWEAPQLLPIGRWSIINGELYGHSSQVPETYKLFDGYNDNGFAVDAQAIFSYQNFGDRANQKSFNELYVEGYIQENTTINANVRFEIDGCGFSMGTEINGTDDQIVCIGGDDRSLGKQRLGDFALAHLAPSTFDQLPPKFRVKKTSPKTDFFEVQFSFASNGIDQRWEILAFGPNGQFSKNDSTYIKQ